MSSRGTSLEAKTARSAIWQILGGGWQTLVRLGASVFLARALRPSDFGIFGMAILFQEFLLHIGSFGVGAGIIAKKQVTQKDLDTCFWIMLTVRFLLFLFAYFGAPIAASFFKEPRLVSVVRVVSLCFLIEVFGMIPKLILSKHLRFALINIIYAISGFLGSLVAVLLALFTDLSYWALVFSTLFSSTLINFLLLIFSKWFPGFSFDWKSFRYFSRFGFYSLGFAISNYLRQNLDYLLVGRLLGSYQLGLYEYAYRIPHLVFDRISRPVGSVIFPALSKVQDDNRKIFLGYLKATKFVVLIAFPLLFGLAAIADVLVPVMWGNQWLPIIIPLQILCFAAAIKCLFQPIGSIFYCKNRPDIPFKISLISLLFTGFSVGVLGYFYGLNGVAVGMLLPVFPSYLILQYVFRRILGVNLFELFRVVFPVLVSSLLCALFVFLFKGLLIIFSVNLVLVLIMSIFFGSVVYFFSLFFLFRSFFLEVLELFSLVSGIDLGNTFFANIHFIRR